jgi:hypothetical protein
VRSSSHREGTRFASSQKGTFEAFADLKFDEPDVPARLYRRPGESRNPNTLTKIAEGHPISRIDELLPWQIGTRTRV